MKRIVYLVHRTDNRSPEKPDLLFLLKQLLLAPSVHSRSSFPPVPQVWEIQLQQTNPGDCAPAHLPRSVL